MLQHQKIHHSSAQNGPPLCPAPLLNWNENGPPPCPKENPPFDELCWKNCMKGWPPCWNGCPPDCDVGSFGSSPLSNRWRSSVRWSLVKFEKSKQQCMYVMMMWSRGSSRSRKKSYKHWGMEGWTHQDSICFVDGGHLLFRTAFIRVHNLRHFSAWKKHLIRVR